MQQLLDVEHPSQILPYKLKLAKRFHLQNEIKHVIESFNSLFGPAIGAIIALAISLLLIGLVIWIVFLVVRRFRGGLFMSGSSKNRLPRLAVTDAAPVDSHRRLILVRRDDVEHLIMIGGPTDIVVETGIGRQHAAAPYQTPARLPVQTAQPQAAQQLPQRNAVIAAREAVADVERGRQVRAQETQIQERRQETNQQTNQDINNQSGKGHLSAPPVVAPSSSSSSFLSDGSENPPQKTVISAPPAAEMRTSAEIDLDKLLAEFRPNVLKDR